MDSQTALIILGAIVVIAIAAAAYLLGTKRRSLHLAERFGPEYEREVARTGDPRKAEAELAQREKRVKKLEIKPLAHEAVERYIKSWKNIQARFVDEPGPAVSEADGLVRKVMEQRGYPMGTFEQCVADISVDHPHVVEHYRAAHTIALSRDKGEASTEDLRQAFLHYRALFDELLEVAPAEVVVTHP